MKQLKCQQCSIGFQRRSGNGPIPKFCKRKCYMEYLKQLTNVEPEVPKLPFEDQVVMRALFVIIPVVILIVIAIRSFAL